MLDLAAETVAERLHDCATRSATLVTLESKRSSTIAAAASTPSCTGTGHFRAKQDGRPAC
jgi:hypothetical protein